MSRLRFLVTNSSGGSNPSSSAAVLGAPVYSIEAKTHKIYLATPQMARLPLKAPQGLNWFGTIVNNY
jgi:hypothetical protein